MNEEEDELTLEELDEVTAGIPEEGDLSKREKFIKGIKVEDDELTEEELDEVKAGIQKEEKSDKER